MGLLDTISGWFSSGSETGGPAFVLDGVGVLNGRSGRPSPRDMIGLLYRLGRFAEKEKVRVTVIFEGEALHKAADGDEFQGVTVYYADHAKDRRGRILEIARQAARKGRITVVCGDAQMEKDAAAAGAQTLRAGTFRKALEMGGDGEGSFENRGDSRGEGRGDGRGDGRGPRRRRGGRDSRDGRMGGGRDGSPQQRPDPAGGNVAGAARPEAAQPAADVRHLIDLVE